MNDPIHTMREALCEAQTAYDAGEVPVGAVVVLRGKIIGRGRNQVEQLHDATAHAEMIALTQAAEATGNWRLDGAEIYVTLEPCPMCAGAILLARVAKVVYGAADPQLGALGSRLDLLRESWIPHHVEIVAGVEAEAAADLLRRFFRDRRSPGGLHPPDPPQPARS